MGNIGDRLQSFRNDINLTQAALARESGISRTYIADVEAGRQDPSFNFVKSLNTSFNLNINWFLTGNGPMFVEESSPREGERKDIDVLRDSNLEQLDCGLYVAGDMVYIPLSTVTACCGSGFDVFDDYNLDDCIAVNRRHAGTLREGMVPFAVQTKGRSMEGFGIREGSIVVINPAEEVYSGHVAMVIYKEQASIKKVYETPDGLDLVASNGQKYHVTYEALTEGWGARICGRVMLVISPPEDGV